MLIVYIFFIYLAYSIGEYNNMSFENISKISARVNSSNLISTRKNSTLQNLHVQFCTCTQVILTSVHVHKLHTRNCARWISDMHRLYPPNYARGHLDEQMSPPQLYICTDGKLPTVHHEIMTCTYVTDLSMHMLWWYTLNSARWNLDLHRGYPQKCARGQKEPLSRISILKVKVINDKIYYEISVDNVYFSHDSSK